MSFKNSLRVEKRILRTFVEAALQSVSPSSIESQSRSITEKVLSLPQLRASRNVSCYLSMPSGEVDTSALIISILRHPGKEPILDLLDQILDKGGIMDFYEIVNERDLDSLPSGTWGIKEPDLHFEGRPRVSALGSPLDVILLPGVAFDRSFARLGHGKGFYDRFISKYSDSGKRKPLLVGLALREQLLESGTVPMGEHDWHADIVITSDEILLREGLEWSA